MTQIKQRKFGDLHEATDIFLDNFTLVVI